MLDHPIVDVALGLILLYTVLSLFASVVKEWISTFLGLRAKNLEKGIQTLIGADYAAKLYAHPLVSTLATEKKLPAYIGSGTFASALWTRSPTARRTSPLRIPKIPQHSWSARWATTSYSDGPYVR